MLIAELANDPDFLFKISWRKFEELIAAAFERDGWYEVILTPRSNDRGRDVIARRKGVGSICILGQVKQYGLHRLVTADEVRAMVGVLTLQRNVSKGIITTTSKFAPGIYKDPNVTALMPTRLELINGTQLSEWLFKLGNAPI